MDSPTPIRYYTIQHLIESGLYKMTKDELNGAHFVINILNSILYKQHFEEKTPIDSKSFVKTIEELDEICLQLFHHKFNAETIGLAHFN